MVSVSHVTLGKGGNNYLKISTYSSDITAVVVWSGAENTRTEQEQRESRLVSDADSDYCFKGLNSDSVERFGLFYLI